MDPYRSSPPWARTTTAARSLALAAAWLAIAACGGPSVRTDAPASDTQGVLTTQVRSGTISSPEIFRAFSVRVASERYVRFLVDLRTGAATFFDANVYPLHSDFVFAEVYHQEITPERLARFMENYEPVKPEFVFSNLVHHVAQDLWTFSFWEGDEMTADHVRQVYRVLRETFYAGDHVRFRPDSEHHADVARQATDVPVMTNDEIYDKVTYQLFNPGERLGVLRVVRSVGEAMDAGPDGILVLTLPVPDLSVCAGIVSEEFSTPLSHVAIRARAWGIPHIGQKNAAELYGYMEGQLVYFSAGEYGHEIRLPTEADKARLSLAADEARQIVIPAADLDQHELRPLTALRAADARAYGAKSANLGEVARAHLDGFLVPPGVGVPIAYYAEHMRRHGLGERVDALLADERFRTDAQVRGAELEALQAAIVAGELDPELLDALTHALADAGVGGDRGLAVRSSTNAEDLPGFSGAGIYDSFLNVRGREAIADKVKRVWASVWNRRAYDEREFYGIDHHGVYGAVLVQEAVNATAAGVLVTTHVLQPHQRHIYTINAKSGLGLRVVEGHKLPEQILFDRDQRSIKVVSRSDEDTKLVFDADGGLREVPVGAKGKTILTDARVLRLGDAATAISGLFPTELPLDIEWLFAGEVLFVVQSRPYVTK